MFTSMRRRRGHVALLASLALAVSLVAACGQSESGDDPSKGAAVTGLEEPKELPATQYPLDLPTEHGTTTLTEAPQRVVALGDIDDVLALGVVPVGTFIPAGGEEQLYDYQQDALDRAKKTSEVQQIEDLWDPYAELDYEGIAELDPDVIVAAGYWDLASSYAKLSSIAPVVALPKGEDSTWESRHRVIAKALDRGTEGEQAIHEVHKTFAEARDEHPEFAERSLTYAVVYPTQVTFMSKTGTEAAWFFTNLGFEASPASDEFGTEYPADIVSEEQTLLLDADVVVIGYHELLEKGQREKFEDGDLFQSLPAVGDGRYVALPEGHSSNIPQPGVLSSTAELEIVLPLLEKIA